jgi:diguanylate cyclase (GGDEF)-like protein
MQLDVPSHPPEPKPRPAREAVAVPGAPATHEELLGCYLFRDQLDEIRERIAGCAVLELAPGVELLSPGSDDRDVFVVLDGKLSVHVETPDDDPIQTIGRGETVGELAFLAEQPRSAYVVAVSSSRVMRIPAELFGSLLATTPGLALAMLASLAGRVRSTNTVLTQARGLAQLYRRHASLDALTGLHNRRWLDEMLPRLVKRAQIQSEPMAAMMIDIDHFKRFNDTFGHAAGDFVIFATARILRERLRPVDLLARYGGEELTALLPRTELRGARVAAERIVRAMAEASLVTPDGIELPSVTVSIGVSELEPEGDATRLLQTADARLYAAKRGGRNRVE